MNEESALFKVYPSTPPNGRNNPGCILITYREQRVYFSFTIMHPAGLETAIQSAQGMIDAHLDSDGLFQIHPECFYRAVEDQRPSDEQRKSTPQSGTAQFINQGYKIKRMVDEDKVYYEIAFRTSNGKEAEFPAKIFNENYLKMLAKSLAEAGYKSSEWETGKPHMINIEFGVSKSEKVGSNGKAYNNYHYFKILPDTEQVDSSPTPF